MTSTGSRVMCVAIASIGFAIAAVSCASYGEEGKPTPPVPGPADAAVADAAAEGQVADDGDRPIATCEDGGCLPMVLVRGQVNPVGIAVRQSRLYWSLDGPSATAVMTCDLPDCAAPAVFASKQPSPVLIDTDADNVYWTTNEGVRTCPFSGCGSAPAQIAAAPSANGLFVGLGKVFWTTFSSLGNVVVAAPTGASATVLGQGHRGPRRVAADSSGVYWTNFYEGAIVRSPITGGGTTTIVTGLSEPWDITLDETRMYFTTKSEVRSCPLASCDAATMTVLASGLERPLGIASDGRHVYWTNYEGNSVMRCPTTGCGAGPTLLAGGQPGAYDITTDDAFVYWTNRSAATPNDPAVVKLRKR